MLIGISYTGQTSAVAYNILIKDFDSADLNRTYSGSAELSTSANGAATISGPSFRQKFIWGISAVVTKEEALQFDQLFRDWDSDRASGLSAAVGIIDQTFGPDVDTNAIITSPPGYERLGPNFVRINFGLAEV